MATILKRIVELASNHPESSSDPARRRQSPVGPEDMLLHILRLLGPKDAAKMSLVCKSLRSLVSDDRLWVFFLQHQAEPWESIFFAETNLRWGYPIQAFSRGMPEVSFMSIYSKRAQVPGSIIIDGGSGYCKIGWSKYECPSVRSATFLEFGNIESPMHSRLRHFFLTIYSRIQIKPSSYPTLVLSL
ncbi:hypothetical protein CRG98_043859 [Punica granatum]|uniref:F-box domain-containing protein n=1 Tax=Punica granatum TaxID=22663 RepID=A0A2I0HVH5_PUNGR|nr:hypothetical protein CRG98_043859 [Punica granatum]